MTDAKTTQISRLVTIAVFLVSLSFSGTSLALTQSAFGYNVSAAGDWGCRATTAEETAKRMVTRNPERVLALGDLSYATTANCWLDILDKNNLEWPVTKIAIGNHDDTSSTLLNQYLNAFDMAHQYRSFQYRNAHFITLSTEIPTDSAQFNFTKSNLARAASDPNTDWIIVIMHKPMYTSPNNHGADATMRDLYHPVFDQYGVDLVLYGHNHSYERSYPLRYDDVGNPATPIKTSSETQNYVNPDGIIFATVGTAGKSIYHYDSKNSYIVTQYENYGFLDINIVENRLVARFYSNNDGSVKDQFTITKYDTD